MFIIMLSFPQEPLIFPELKNAYHLPTKSLFLREIKTSCEWYLLQRESSAWWRWGQREWGDFQVCRRIFLMREYLFTPDGRSSPLPPVSFLPSPHYPKWPFLLLPLREEEQECLGRVRLNLVCLGGIIHFTRHRMGCCLNLAFSFELLREVYGTRHSLKQAKIGLICLLCEVLPLLSAHPSQVVPKSTVNWFTEVWQELMVKPLARHP